MYFAVQTALNRSVDTLATARQLLRKMTPRDWNVRSATFPTYVIEQIVSQSVLLTVGESLPAAETGAYTEVLLRNRYPATTVLEPALARLDGVWSAEKLRSARRQAVGAYTLNERRVAACEECQQLEAKLERDAPVAAAQTERLDAEEHSAAERMMRLASR